MKQFLIPAFVVLGLAGCGESNDPRGANGQRTGTIESLPAGGYAPPKGGVRSGVQGDPLIYASGGFAAPAYGQGNAPSDAQADTFARSFLNSIQPRSIAERREYCGYFFVGADGRIGATPPIPGTFAGCAQPVPERGQGVFASYHTHGAYGPNYDNEVPSPTDLQGDFSFGIDGYVSTPGGRVWRIEYDTRDTFQICGRGCVTVDPGFVPEGERGIRQRFSLDDLFRRGA